jgi:predicted acyltransferase
MHYNFVQECIIGFMSAVVTKCIFRLNQHCKKGAKTHRFLKRNEMTTEKEEKMQLLPSSVGSTNVSMLEVSKTKRQQRVLALDIVRGMTIVLMIIANSMPAFSYWPFHHAEWNGVTPTDFVFPFFLFIMGYAIAITFRGVHELNELMYERDRINFMWCIPVAKYRYDWIWIWIKIWKRTIILFSIGMAMNFAVAVPDFKHMRIMNVMQRIALCYLTVSCLVCTFNTVLQIAFVAALQVLYITFTFAINVPYCGRGRIDGPKCCVEGYIDRILFGQNHLFEQNYYDPEGALSTLSAILTCYMGVVYFKLTRISRATEYRDNLYRQITHWLMMTSVLLPIAFTINVYFPFNKKIWSTSFAILTPALAGMLLSIITFVVDVKGFGKFWTLPFLWVGSNPLLLYIGPEFLQGILQQIPVGSGPNNNLFQWIFKNMFVSWIGNVHFAALLFSITFEAIWFPLAAFLYYKKIYIKI